MSFLDWLFRRKPKVIVERTLLDAKLPFYADAFAAGADLIAAEDMVIPPKGQRLIKTGLKMKLPKDHYLRIESRSGLSVKFQLEKGAGIIDENYRKEIGIVLYNHGYGEYHIKAGERVAQGILTHYRQAQFIEGQVTDTGRGGYGSTGK